MRFQQTADQCSAADQIWAEHSYQNTRSSDEPPKRNSCAGTLSTTSVRSRADSDDAATGSKSTGPLGKSLAKALTMGVAGQCCVITPTLENNLWVIIRVVGGFRVIVAFWEYVLFVLPNKTTLNIIMGASTGPPYESMASSQKSCRGIHPAWAAFGYMCVFWAGYFKGFIV